MKSLTLSLRLRSPATQFPKDPTNYEPFRRTSVSRNPIATHYDRPFEMITLYICVRVCSHSWQTSIFFWDGSRNETLDISGRAYRTVFFLKLNAYRDPKGEQIGTSEQFANRKAEAVMRLVQYLRMDDTALINLFNNVDTDI